IVLLGSDRRWILGCRKAAKHVQHHLLFDCGRIVKLQMDSVAGQEYRALSRAEPIDSVPLFDRVMRRRSLIERDRRVSCDHAVAWQVKAMLAIPGCSIFVRLKSLQNLKYRSEPPMGLARVEVPLLNGQIYHDIILAKPRGELIKPAQ